MVFDAHVSYGAVVVPAVAPCKTPADLVYALDWSGIDRALVFASAIIKGCPSEANVMVAEELAQYPRLEPVWAVLPSETEELGGPSDLLANMEKHSVRALTAFPSKHRFLLDRTGMGDILDTMAAHSIPLFLHLSENSHGLTSWSLVSQLLEQTPGLRIVALGSGPWGEDRCFRPLLKRYPTLYVETSRYELDGGIAELCRKYGGERLIYGSGYPEFAMGGALITAMHADISDDEKEMILGGNLQRLLDEVDL